METAWALVSPLVLFAAASWGMGWAQAVPLRAAMPARRMGACLALGALLSLALWLAHPPVVDVLPRSAGELALRTLQALAGGAFFGACVGALVAWASLRRPPRLHVAPV